MRLHRLSFACLATACLAGGSAFALSPPHDASHSITCDDCHAMHGGGMGFGLIARGADQEVQCKSCHNPTGQAASMSDIGNHVVHGGQIVDCGSCHDPHGPQTTTDPHVGGTTAPNLHLIRGNTHVYTPQAVDPAIFQVQPAHFAFDNAPFVGICQTCHTQTNYARNDGTNPHHMGVQDCTTCHPHSAGFLPTGGACTSCHAKAQDNGDGVPLGGRRAIVPEFSLRSHHVAGTVADSDCTVCHDTSQHQKGYVRLKNVDDPTSLAKVIQLSANPATRAADADLLETFCLACHDPNGANGTAPFSDKASPPVIDSSGWSMSAHATSAATCFGDDATFGCHASGHGSNKSHLLAPAATVPTAPNYPEEEEGFCNGCHDGTPAPNIVPEFSKASRHPVAVTGRVHSPTEAALVNSPSRHVECVDCHEPHQAKARVSLPAPSTTPRPASGPLAKVMGINAAGAVVNPAAYEYELCLRCHADSTGLPAAPTARQFPQMNCRLEFNGSSTSYHFVAVANPTPNAHVPSLLAGWTTTSFMACTSCHNNDGGSNNGAGGTGPNGPHGSAYPSLLERKYVVGTSSSYNVANYALCFKCHDSTSILGNRSFTRHATHIQSASTPCNVCHDPHASSGNKFLINFNTSAVTANSGGVLKFVAPGTNGDPRGYCYLRCHGENHGPYSYTPGY